MVTFIDRLGAQLQTIERGVSRQSFALIAFQYPILSEWIALAGDQAMDGIKPQMVMIIEIFVAKHQAPLIATALLAAFGSGYVIAVYILFCAMVSVVATVLLPDYTNCDISGEYA